MDGVRMRSFPPFRAGFLLAVASAAALCLSACDESQEARAARLVKERQEQLAKDQQDRATLIAQTKAALAVQDKKREAIAGVRAQIDAIDEQISFNRQRGRDCTALEKAADGLEEKIYEIERR